MWIQNSEEEKQQYTNINNALQAAIEKFKPTQPILMTVLLKRLVAETIRIYGPEGVVEAMSEAINGCMQDLKTKGII